MFIDLDGWRAGARAGEAPGASASTSLVEVGAGSGDFMFDVVTVGVLLKPQPGHHARYASDRIKAVPLAAGEGWIFPAGMEGGCVWGGDHAFLTASLPKTAFADADAAAIGRPSAGALDPLTVTLVLQLHAAGPDAPDTALYRGGLAAALGAHLAREAIRPVAASVLDDARLKRVVDAIEADLARAWTLDDLAGLAAMSPFHFARTFKARTGLAPHRFLIERRILRAKVLLRATSDPVATIAFKVGWENASKFAARFKAEVGATPGAWRAG